MCRCFCTQASKRHKLAACAFVPGNKSIVRGVSVMAEERNLDEMPVLPGHDPAGKGPVGEGLLGNGMAGNGAEEQMVRLVAEFAAPLYRYAYRLSGSAADAEDLTQQTFLI